ncbi:hypothetical protein BC941DRAFT_409019 [Chlamydoabsidia padenii]|nr:hypothetical protein BC941DRAFT_409019 [Chlamydoabsidia padenii]
MDQLPTEVILHVISFIHDTKDKIELLRANRYIKSLIIHNQSCWSSLDLSLYRDRINNGALIGILRSLSLDIVLIRRETPPSPPPTKRQHLLVSPTSPPTSHRLGTLIENINLSGCHLVTPDALLMLVYTLPCLKVLHLNKYPATSIPDLLATHPRHCRRTRSTMIDMLRDDLYQCRPRHGLSSSTMDLSKQPLASLTIVDATLLRLLPCTPFLTNLSLQHQLVSHNTCCVMEKELVHLRHLDISSCQINVNSLQYLIRTMAASLISLKMLNLELSDLTLLCLQQHGKNSLECLHLSCLNPSSLPGLARTLRALVKLTDFRMTRLPSGNVDPLILRLATRQSQLRCLDLSPKLELYPTFVSGNHSRPFSSDNTAPIIIQPSSTSSTTTRLLKQQQQSLNKNLSLSSSSHLLPPNTSNKSRTRSGKSCNVTDVTFTRSERGLHLTDISFHHLAYNLTHLVELRLCFPTVRAGTLTRFFKSAKCPLRVLELRLRDTNDDDDYLDGLENLDHLETLLLYSVPMNTRSVDIILHTRRLKSMTIHDAKQLGKLSPLFLRRWLLGLPRLGLLRMDRVPFAWTSISDLLLPEQDYLYQPDHPLYNGDSMFIRTSSGIWQWVN